MCLSGCEKTPQSGWKGKTMSNQITPEQIDEIKAALEESRAEIERLHRGERTLHKAIDIAQDMIDAHNVQSKQLHTEIEWLQTELAIVREDYAKANAENARLREVVRQYEDVCRGDCETCINWLTDEDMPPCEECYGTHNRPNWTPMFGAAEGETHE